MRSLVFLRRLRGTARTAAFEREMAAELELHLQLEAEALVGRGLDPSSARREAQRRFGSIAEVEDRCRDSWGLRVLDSFAHDVRYAARTLVGRHRVHTAVVVATLALGIGANTAIFSVVHAVLLRALPYASGEALVEIRQQGSAAGIENISVSAPELADYRREAASLDAIVEYHQMGFNLLDSIHGRAPSRVVTGVVSADFFDVIGVKPMLGRTFVAADDRADAAPVLVVSYAYWRDTLGSDPDIVGRTFEMNDRVHTVVGVLPNVPLYPDEDDVYMPVSACPFRSAPHMATNRGMRMVAAIGRMRPGVSIETARRDVAAIASRMAAAHPDVYPAAAGFGADALSVRDELTRRARPTLLVLLGATAFVLLLVCANVANLTLSRLRARERELSLRAALGAGRGRIARQLLTEAVLLALAGGTLGLGAAAFTHDLLVAFAARLTPRAAEITMDWTTVVFTFAVTLATGMVFGVLAAIRGSQSMQAPRGARARQTLVGAQVAISFVLLVGAGLMVRSFIKLQRVDAGFQSDRVVTAQVDLDWVKYDSVEKRRTFFRPLLAQLEALPGVSHAALSLTLPLNESATYTTDFLLDHDRSNQPYPDADFRLVSPRYFETLGIKVLAGRTFTESDTAGGNHVAIVNYSMARHQFGGGDALGRRVSFDRGRTWTTIVGIVNDVKQYGLDAAPVDEIYLPLEQRGPLAAKILVRTEDDANETLAAIARTVRQVDPLQPLSRPQTLDQVRQRSLSSARLTMELVSLLALIALAITAIGIAAVVAFGVNQRLFEIGVRIALGAPRASVVRMVVREGLQPVGVGLAIGCAAALATTRAVEKLLYGVHATDAATYAAVFVALAAVSAVACISPARRAAGVEPAIALRTE